MRRRFLPAPSLRQLASAGLSFAALLTASGPALAQPKPAPAAPQIVNAPISASARDVLAKARPSIVQIKGYFGSNTAQAFHGTGFAVAADGLLLTNYHVVAAAVLYPEKFRLEYASADGASGRVQVLAIDVLHDLAVVRAEGFAARALALNAVVPAKGTRAFAIGFPLDVGLTITEGVSNGRVEDSFGARIHYSGALNAGMSGGPALNGAGEVIGINVAGYQFQQLVAFLVPALHAEALIRRAVAEPLAAGASWREVGAQLRAHSRELLGGLDGPIPTQRIAGYRLPGKLASFIECNAGGDPAPDRPVQQVQVSCGAKAGLHVQQGLDTGDFRYSHYVLSTENLDAWRFARRLSSLAAAVGGFGNARHVGPFACRNRVVALRGFDASLLICTRALKRFEGLHDLTVRVISLNEAKRGFASHLDMYGMEFEPAMRLLRRFLDSLEWTGAER